MPEKKNDKEMYDALAEAIKEQTKAIADLAEIVKGMKESHDKWVKAGRFGH